jgi:hypothetical protein
LVKTLEDEDVEAHRTSSQQSRDAWKVRPNDKGKGKGTAQVTQARRLRAWGE